MCSVHFGLFGSAFNSLEAMEALELIVKPHWLFNNLWCANKRACSWKYTLCHEASGVVGGLTQIYFGIIENLSSRLLQSLFFQMCWSSISTSLRQHWQCQIWCSCRPKHLEGPGLGKSSYKIGSALPHKKIQLKDLLGYLQKLLFHIPKFLQLLCYIVSSCCLR